MIWTVRSYLAFFINGHVLLVLVCRKQAMLCDITEFAFPFENSSRLIVQSSTASCPCSPAQSSKQIVHTVSQSQQGVRLHFNWIIYLQQTLRCAESRSVSEIIGGRVFVYMCAVYMRHLWKHQWSGKWVSAKQDNCRYRLLIITIFLVCPSDQPPHYGNWCMYAYNYPDSSLKMLNLKLGIIEFFLSELLARMGSIAVYWWNGRCARVGGIIAVKWNLLAPF